MKTGDEKLLSAYAAKDFVDYSIEDIIMVTVLPKTTYHFDLPSTGKKISHKSKIRKKRNHNAI